MRKRRLCPSEGAFAVADPGFSVEEVVADPPGMGVSKRIYKFQKKKKIVKINKSMKLKTTQQIHLQLRK